MPTAESRSDGSLVSVRQLGLTVPGTVSRARGHSDGPSVRVS